MINPVMIFGAGSFGKAVYDVLKSNGIEIYAFLDDDKELHNKTIGEVSILGNTDDDGFLKYIGKKCDAFVAVDDMRLKKTLVEMLKKKRKVMPVTVVHNAAQISELASISYGTFVGANTSIGAGSVLSEHCVINTNASIDYDVKIGKFTHIGTGSNINSEAEIGNNVFIGSGVTIVSGIKVEDNARIGAGSVVVDNVTKGATIFGNPAKAIK
ncbi:MAG: acetyltransferase [Bacteroidota bacterium]